jgi:transcriptional regulator with XRE-family HTH domain
MNRIKDLRKEFNLTQQELAAKIGVSRSTVAMWETSGSSPDVDFLNILSDYFCVSVDYLICRSDERKKEAPSEDETSEKDPVIDEIIELLLQLSPEQLQKELYYLRRIAGDPDTE